jgi:DNA modification methylase
MLDSNVAIKKQYSTGAKIVLECNESINFSRKLLDKSIQLIITSSPYNIGKAYETRTSINDYLNAQRELIQDLVRVLDDKGSICWQVGNYVDNGEVFPLDIFYYSIFKDMGLQLRNRVIWHFGHGLHARNRFSGRYETLLWFTN